MFVYEPSGGGFESSCSPFPLYVAVKSYSSSRSKTLVNWLYFCTGISLPYKSFLELTRDITNRKIFQDNKDGAFLPRTLRKGILTIIAKDSINQNPKSTAAKRHYHKTLSIFQFPIYPVYQVITPCLF